jgi:hypothetical protein
MASTGVYGSAYNVVPVPATATGFTPTVLATANTTGAPGAKAITYTTAGTGGVLPAGTYFVGGSFVAQNNIGLFLNSDQIGFSINSSANDIAAEPTFYTSGYSQQTGGSIGYITATVTGILILPSSSAITWYGNLVMTTGYSSVNLSVENPYYYQIS